MRTHHMRKMLKYLSLLSALLMAVVMFGCEGDKGGQGPAGTSTGTLQGTVRNSLNQAPVAGATLTLSPTIENQAPITTDTNGNFSASLPLTVYTVTVSAPNFASQTFTASVLAGQTTTKNISLVPTANAVVTVAPVTNATPGTAVTLKAVPQVFTNTTSHPTFHWVQTSGPAATTFSNVSSATPTIVLGNRAAYKQALAVVEAPRQSVDPNTEVAVFSRLNRTQVLGLTNEALVTGGQATFAVTMTAGGTTVTTPVTVSVRSFFVPQTSTRNVPIGQPVLLQGRSFTNNVFSSAVVPVPQTTWNWTLAVPAGSSAALNDPTTINPDFIPDVVGVYTVTESVSGQHLTIYAGTWQGAITGLDANGDPTANPVSSGTNPPVIGGNAGIIGCPCHYAPGDTQIGKFTRAWNLSGHSHIVSGLTAHLPGGPTVQNITDPNGHWSATTCGPCHTVGFAQYSSPIKANGFSEVSRAEGFRFTFGPNAWVQTVQNFPQTASLMQIQCENCHGPSASPGHTTVGPAASPASGSDFFARVSWSSDVCGVCHGEPTRHGKYQQWRESGHGDFETAMFEGLTGASATSLGGINPSCGGCHVGQAFGTFNRQLQSGNASRTLSGAPTFAQNPQLATVNLDTVQPQVCVTCHGPHNPGTKTGSIVSLAGYDPTYGTTFVGTTPLLPAGFQAAGVGKGALCIVCHESRNGEPVAGAGNPTLHENGDPNWDPNLASFKATNYATPHEAAQGDVLLGRNAYFVKGVRGPHSTIADTCVTCHMELMPAPHDIDPARLGTNHNFNININPAEGGTDICLNCHQFSGLQIQQSFVSQLSALETAIAAKIFLIKNGTAIPSGTTAVVNYTFQPSISVTTGGVTTTTPLKTYLAGSTYLGFNPATGTRTAVPATGLIPVIFEAVWNTALLINDSSEGTHNPRFENDVLQETYIAVSTF
jgi:hypothetical protein